jgi:hypothetical protein
LARVVRIRGTPAEAKIRLPIEVIYAQSELNHVWRVEAGRSTPPGSAA